MQDFASIAKSVKLSNHFLMSFAQMVQQKNERQLSNDQISKGLDVLLAMMEKVKLKKENYVPLMKELKIFVNDAAT